MRDVLFGLLGASWAMWLLWKGYVWAIQARTHAQIASLTPQQRRELRRRMLETPDDAMRWLEEVTRHG